VKAAVVATDMGAAPGHPDQTVYKGRPVNAVNGIRTRGRTGVRPYELLGERVPEGTPVEFRDFAR
jgi:hypothetical protein